MDEDEPGTPVKKGRPKKQSLLSRYPPITEVQNDATSNERDLKALKKEMDKDRPRKDVVLSLLTQTFIVRRDEILSEGSQMTITSIISAHKALTLPYAVCDYCSMYYNVWFIILKFICIQLTLNCNFLTTHSI